MVQVGVKNPILIITPVTQEEINEGFGWASIYVLYKNKNNKVEIGIPDMLEYSSKTANMAGVSESTEIALFYNGGSKLMELAPHINNRPVYAIQPSDNRKVAFYDVINNVDVKLSDVLNGSFKVNNNIEKNEHICIEENKYNKIEENKHIYIDENKYNKIEDIEHKNKLKNHR